MLYDNKEVLSFIKTIDIELERKIRKEASETTINLHKNNSKWNKYVNWYKRNRRKTNSGFNLNERISSAIRSALKDNKIGRHWEDLVDYTLNDLIEHLKSTLPKGYNWKDYLHGDLHIDHVIPQRAFIFERPEDSEFKNCWNLHNLRLLTAKRNLQKGENFDNPILLGLLIKKVKDNIAYEHN